MTDESYRAVGGHPRLPPVTCHRSPLRAFLEIPIADDPHYQTLEIQLLETNGGTGVIVHLLDHERRLDVYADPSLGLDDRWFAQDASTSHMRRGELRNDLTGPRGDGSFATLDVEHDSVTANANFVDKHGRTISVHAHAKRQPQWRWGHVFTPAPAAINDPKLLRLLMMSEFWLLPKSADVSVAVDGKARTPSTFPLPVGGRQRLHGRFAYGISLLAVNPEFEGTHPAIETLEWSRAGGNDNIASMTATAEHDLVLRFEPPLAPSVDHGMILFRLGGQRIGKGSFSRTAQTDNDSMRWMDVDQHWLPTRPWPTAAGLELARRIKRRSVRYHWSSGPPARWQTGPKRG